MVGTGGRAQAHSVPRVVVVVFVLMAVLLARLALLFVPGAPGGAYRWTWATVLCLLPLPTTVLAAWLARRRVAVPPASA